MFSQRFSGVRLGVFGDGFRRASDKQMAALVSAFRAEVEDPIGAFDDVKVVFDHQHWAACFDEALEGRLRRPAEDILRF